MKANYLDKKRLFFFEKKNQKTFGRCRGPIPQGGFLIRRFRAVGCRRIKNPP
jgi:hypothetical protein